jgi:hypothetical protein
MEKSMAVRSYAALAAVVIGVSASSGAGAAEAANGFSVNGISLNGISLNGVSLNGISLNGRGVQGRGLNGVASGKTQLKAVILQDGSVLKVE